MTYIICDIDPQFVVCLCLIEGFSVVTSNLIDI
jgi:hypothetical protein